MPVYTQRQGTSSQQLRRWRVAADPPPDPFAEAADEAVRKEEKRKEEKKAPPGGAPTQYTYAVMAQLEKKARALLDANKLHYDFVDNQDPRVEASGVDLSYRLTSPTFKGAILTVSWTKKGSVRSFLETVLGVKPDQLTLYFCDGVYVTTAAQTEPFLKALATLQSAMMHAATEEETAVENILEPPKKGTDLSELEARARDERIMTTLRQLESANPSLDLTNANAVLDAAVSSVRSNNITKPQLKELQTALKARVKPAGAWKSYVEGLGGEAGATDYRTSAIEEAVVAEVQKLTDGLYKGKPQVGYYSQGDKSYINAALTAPFPFHFTFVLGGGNKLVLYGAGARICLNDYTVTADKAKDLLYADLSLGIAAKQAAQVPDEIKNRGKKVQELSDAEEAELEALERELGGRKPKEKERGYQDVYQSKLYPIVLSALLTEVGKDPTKAADVVGQPLVDRINQLKNQEEIGRADLLDIFTKLMAAVGWKSSEEKILDLLDAVEGDRSSKPTYLGRDAVRALKAMKPKKPKA